MDENTILIRSDNATFQIVEGEAILIRMDTGNYYSLNKVATTFWEMLDGELTIAGLASTIARQYNQRSTDFVSELRALAEQPATADRDERRIELAERYGVEPATVSENLRLMAGPEAERQAADVLTNHLVALESVTADLLELAKELNTEKLVEINL
jgi:hypothetical protein